MPWRGCREINSLRIFGRAKEKGAIVSFNMEGAHAHDISTVIDRAGVAVRAGTHCTQPCSPASASPPPAGRPSAMYNTRAEVDKLAEALISAQRIFLMSEAIEPSAAPRQRRLRRRRPFRADELARMTDDIVAALKTVYDPEIPVDIYELGLIYKVDIDDDRNVKIDMTLTAPGCPVAGDMPGWVENAVGAVPGVSGAKVNLVFDPPWDQSRMSDEARVALNMW